MNEVKGTSAMNQREIIYIEPAAKAQPLKLRVAGYARVSSDSSDQLNSLSAQLRYYTELITANSKWELVEVYCDEAETGTSTVKRDDFNRMLADCRRGKIDRIITKSTSRFARNVLDSLKAVRELKAIGVSVFFEKENLDTERLSSEVLLTLYSAFAQEESLSISQNKKRGNRMHMANGDYVSSSVPYGYRLVNKLPQVYEPEAQVVRRIFREYLDGLSTSQIVKGLMLDGVPRKEGERKWRRQTISIILRNERYIGDMRLQKTFQTDTLPYVQITNRGQLNQYYIRDTHESIIDRVQFKLANLLLDERATLVSTRHSENLLSGKIQCKHCGTRYRRIINNAKVYWVCRRHNENAADCPSERIPEPDIYATFVNLYNKLKENYTSILLPMLTQLEKLRDKRNRNNPEVQELNKQIADLSEQIHVMNGLMSRGILDSALFISQSDELNRQLREHKQAKARLLKADEDDDIIEKTDVLIGALEDGPDAITAMDEALFTALVNHITVCGETLVFRLHNGLALTEPLDRTVR